MLQDQVVVQFTAACSGLSNEEVGEDMKSSPLPVHLVHVLP